MYNFVDSIWLAEIAFGGVNPVFSVLELYKHTSGVSDGKVVLDF